MQINEVLASKGSSVSTIAAEAGVAELVAALTERRIGAMVVSHDGWSVAGIVSERDVVHGLHTNPDVLGAQVRDIMTADVRTCAPTDTVDQLAQVMTALRIRHVPVLVEHRLAGIVRIGDVVKSRIGELEFERGQLENYITSGS